MARMLRVIHALEASPDDFPGTFDFEVRDGVLHVFTSSALSQCAKAYNRDLWASVEHVEVS